MRRRGAILLSAAVVVVLAASAWAVPASISPVREGPDARDEPSAVVSGAVLRADTVLGTPAQMLDRRSRPAERHRALLAAVVSLPLLMALAVLWRRAIPIGGRAPEWDRGRAVAARAPPPDALFPAAI